MKTIYYLFICSLFITQTIHCQTIKSRQVYDSTFKFKITIPESFSNISEEELAKTEDDGAKIFENSSGTKISKRPKTIFIAQSDPANYFSSNYQFYDTVAHKDYIEYCKNINVFLYKTLHNQMQEYTFDSSTSTVLIADLVFQLYTITISLHNKLVLQNLVYSRVFGNKEFSFTIMYNDITKGNLMLNSWKNSTFKNNL